MSEEPANTENRKNEHLQISLEQNVNSEISAGWENVHIPHVALPEINFKNINLETNFLGQNYSCPFLISSMTGGTPRGDEINEKLCALAESENIPMGVGSQRVALENREKKTFALRKKFPRAKLFANIGLVQFNYGVTVDDCQWLVDELQAQAFIVHANVLQEAIQKEGDRDFSGLIPKLVKLKKKISVPLILKETGCGLDLQSCLQARDAGVDALDIAGMGGTHWGFIEGLRHPERRALGDIFRNWGLPTATALTEALQGLGPTYPVIASGGIQNGLDAAKSLYLGAHLAGMAQAFLKAAQGDFHNLKDFLDLQKEALKIALFCSGSKSIEELRLK